MLNSIWLGLMIASVIFGVIDGKIPQVVQAVTASAKHAFEIALGLTGVMVFWLGLMRIAEASGLVNGLARVMRPLLRRLFPEVPADHPAMGSMMLNIAANMLGLANAATPFGLHAMRDLQSLNDSEDTASDAMCTFLTINTSSVQLIPATAIAFLAAAGATNPTDVILSSLLATSCSTVAGIVSVKLLRRMPYYQHKPRSQDG